MKNLSRRRFLAAGSAMLGSAGFDSIRIARVCADDESSKATASTRPPRIFELGKMPRVDIHTHIKIKELDRAGEFAERTGKFIATMDAGRVDISVNLSCTREMLKQTESIREKWKGRILLCPGDFDTRDGLWWSEDDLKTFKEKRCAGTKIWAQYRQGVLAVEFEKKVRLQGKLGLPVIGFHVADPPQGKWLKPNYWDCIREAAKLIQRCPETTFIMAHGFWLMNEDRGLDLLADYFDRFPNLNADLCAVYQWWDPPKPTYKKLRDFIIEYKDRLLFGTDGNPGYSTPEKLKRVYHILESDDAELKSFFRNETNLRGLSLPIEVLNHIYYWNAARLVPEVRRSLEQRGYKLS